VTPALFLLMRSQRVPPEIFTCPYNDVKTYELDSPFNVAARSNFTDYRKNLGYSFAKPLYACACRGRGLQAERADESRLPGCRRFKSRHRRQLQQPEPRRRGQNVLYADGHVHWESSPLVGTKRDNTLDNTYANQKMARR